ncbi:antitoxin [Leptospira borgpetersenii]|nr:antitoxin [Leptospira borgpetersenii]MBE8434622.1 antitoxin [Leptospira borgpetersenii serovar Tarassovi]MBF3349538.1 antitoxin [Leptospira borgpetersenii serovar Balcanica]UVA64555.1 antitoxin [Leptospira borgpetersenii]
MKMKVLEIGIPDQTLVSSMLHRYVTDRSRKRKCTAPMPDFKKHV